MFFFANRSNILVLGWLVNEINLLATATGIKAFSYISHLSLSIFINISWIFFKNATKEFKMLDYFSALLFLVGIIIFLARTLKASMIAINVNYPKSTDLLNTFIYSYLFFMSSWLSVILIIRAMRLPNSKNSINLEK